MNKTSDAKKMRSKAEENLAKQPASLAEKDVKRLLHELQVHKIELEMQNEELRQANLKLNEREIRFRKIIEDTPSGYFCIDLEGRFQHVNTAWLRMHGYDSPEEVIGRHFSMTQEATDIGGAQLLVNKLLDGTPIPNGEFSRRCKDGSICHHIFSANPLVQDGEIVGLEGFLIDITELNENKKYINLSREVLEILNRPGNIQDSFQSVVACLKTKMKFDAVGIRFQDGNDYPFIVHDGLPKDFLSSENTLIERAVDGGLCRNEDGNFSLECTCGLVISGKTDPANPLFTSEGSCWTNDAFSILDIPPDIDPRLHPRNECIHQGYASIALIPIRTGEKIVGLILFNDKLKNRLNPDSIKLLESIGAHLGSYMMRKQIEEQKRLFERHLQQVQKLDALGRLAGGVAHDLNNLLVPILGCTDLALNKLGETESSLAPLLQQVQKAGSRAADMVSQVLAFGRRQKLELQPLDMNQVITKLQPMLLPLMNAHIELVLDLDSDLPHIMGDQGKLEQVLVNLAINAKDAMPEEGTLNIRTRKMIAPLNPDDDIASDTSSSENILIQFIDTGHGIDQETQTKIFEPYFTTRGPGKGSGLGLSIVQGIVAQHEGSVSVESQLASGSTFSLTFPVTRVSVSQEPMKQTVNLETLMGKETILVVDDEEMVLQTVCETLRANGYQIIEATSGTQALELFRKPPAPIDLVLTDMTMPKMTGRELARKCLRISPMIPIVIMSGYSRKLLESDPTVDGSVEFIQKPFMPQELLSRLKRILA